MMAVCQICGDKGYSKALAHCVQCQDVAVHRYCVLCPSIFEGEEFSWSCEFCDPGKTKSTTPIRESEGLSASIEPAAPQKTAQEKLANNSFPSQSEKSNAALEGAAKGATDLSILDQKKQFGIVRRKRSKRKKRGSPVLPHVSDATKDLLVTDIGKADSSCNDANECKKELSQGSRRRRRSANAKKGKEIKDSISDNSVKKGCSESSQETEQKIKSVNSSDTTGCQLVKIGKDAGPLLSEVDATVNESTCMAGDVNQGDSELVKQEKVTGSLMAKSKIHTEESSCNVVSQHFEESHTSTNQTQDAELADHADKRKTEIQETAIVLCQQADVQTIHDVSDCPAPRKKRKLVIEVEYSDEDPVIVVSKHPRLLADVAKDPSSKSSSEAFSKLSDDRPAQLSSVESVLTRPPPRKVDDRVLTRETSVVFDNCVFTPPSPTILVNYVPAQPLIDVAWRGHCSIGNNEYFMSLELEAHLSNKAHEKVQGAVNLLPQVLNLHFAPKKYAQPRSFEESPPTSDVIGLFLFPVDEWAEKVYDCLVNLMIVHGLLLKSVINNLEFLVFCSRELPQEEWSFQRKYYLWAVFKPIKDPIMPNNQFNNCISNVQSPIETFYLQNDPSILYSNTHLHREPVGQPARLTGPICWNPHNQAYNGQGYDIH